jgi:hypothetical protein
VPLVMISTVILRFTLDRRVRKALSSDKIYDAFPDYYYGFQRAFIFGAACVLPYVRKSWVIKLHYDNFDVASYANRFETFVSYITIISLFFL